MLLFLILYLWNWGVSYRSSTFQFQLVPFWVLSTQMWLERSTRCREQLCRPRLIRALGRQVFLCGLCLIRALGRQVFLKVPCALPHLQMWSFLPEILSLSTQAVVLVNSPFRTTSYSTASGKSFLRLFVQSFMSVSSFFPFSLLSSLPFFLPSSQGVGLTEVTQYTCTYIYTVITYNHYK